MSNVTISIEVGKCECEWMREYEESMRRVTNLLQSGWERLKAERELASRQMEKDSDSFSATS